MIGSMPLMPCAESPSAIALTSSGCSPQNCAICSKDSAVLSTSQTAVALGISSVLAIAKILLVRPRSRAGGGLEPPKWEIRGLYNRSQVKSQRVWEDARQRRRQHNLGPAKAMDPTAEK